MSSTQKAAWETDGLLRRSFPHTRERRAAFWQGAGDEPASFILDVASTRDIRVVYLVNPPMDAAWWREPLGRQWAIDQWHNAADRRTAVYRKGPLMIDFRLASSWFASDDSELCRKAWDKLSTALHAYWGPVVMLATPAATGRELVEMSLPFASAIPLIPQELREYLWALAPQGRIEHLPAPDSDGLDALYQLDARWMYLACLAHPPLGRVVDDHENEYAPHVPGFYEATATVPDGWRHIGLLPRDRSDRKYEKLTYPNTPGQTFPVWATGAEIGLALSEGWRVDIHSRILWPDSQREADPLRPWVDKLKEARARLAAQAAAGDDAAGLAADAVREISVQTIGSWFSHESERHGMVPLNHLEELPPGLANLYIDGGAAHWTRIVAPEPAVVRFQHPEWSAYCWGNTRMRLARCALSLPYCDIVELRTDAIWTRKPPHWAVDPRNPSGPGSWRVKSQVIFPKRRAWPADEAGVLALMREAR